MSHSTTTTTPSTPTAVPAAPAPSVPASAAPVVPLGHVLAAELRAYARTNPTALRPSAVADLHLVLVGALALSGHLVLPAPAAAVLPDAVLTPADTRADVPAEEVREGVEGGHTVLVVYTGLGEPQVHRPDCAEGLRLCKLPDVGHEVVTVADHTALAAHVYKDQIAEGDGPAESLAFAFAYKPCASL